MCVIFLNCINPLISNITICSKNITSFSAIKHIDLQRVVTLYSSILAGSNANEIVNTAYLDIIKSVKEKFKIPVFAYQVSGEYSLISNAIQKKLVNEDVVLESLMSFKRAGANAIVSYYADRIDKIFPVLAHG